MLHICLWGERESVRENIYEISCMCLINFYEIRYYTFNPTTRIQSQYNMNQYFFGKFKHSKAIKELWPWTHVHHLLILYHCTWHWFVWSARNKKQKTIQPYNIMDCILQLTIQWYSKHHQSIKRKVLPIHIIFIHVIWIFFFKYNGKKQSIYW